jgi:hypothetical protein
MFRSFLYIGPTSQWCFLNTHPYRPDCLLICLYFVAVLPVLHDEKLLEAGGGCLGGGAYLFCVAFRTHLARRKTAGNWIGLCALHFFAYATHAYTHIHTYTYCVRQTLVMVGPVSAHNSHVSFLRAPYY